MIVYLYLFLGKTKTKYALKKKSAENFYEKQVSNQTDGFLYYMWMLPSKVMPYLFRLAAPLTDSSIVHCNLTMIIAMAWIPYLGTDPKHLVCCALVKTIDIQT